MAVRRGVARWEPYGDVYDVDSYSLEDAEQADLLNYLEFDLPHKPCPSCERPIPVDSMYCWVHWKEYRRAKDARVG